MKNPATSSEKPSISLVEAIPALERYASKGGWICFFAGFIGALILGWYVFPMLLYSSQPQPMNFNHALHLNPDVVDGIEGETDTERCLYCHEFREDGTFVGIPRLNKCTECHDDPESPMGETDAEAAFLKDYVAKGREIPWISYSGQPDCVYFSHIAHVRTGKLNCVTCHGKHAETEVLPEQKANRITGYPIGIWGKNISGWKTNTWDRMKMDDCAECHTQKGHEENNACFVCHK